MPDYDRMESLSEMGFDPMTKRPDGRERRLYSLEELADGTAQREESARQTQYDRPFKFSDLFGCKDKKDPA